MAIGAWKRKFSWTISGTPASRIVRTIATAVARSSAIGFCTTAASPCSAANATSEEWLGGVVMMSRKSGAACSTMSAALANTGTSRPSTFARR